MISANTFICILVVAIVTFLMIYMTFDEDKPKSNKHLPKEERLLNDVYSYIIAQRTFVSKPKIDVHLPYKLKNRLIMLTDEEEDKFIKNLSKRLTILGTNYNVEFEHGKRGLHDKLILYAN